MAEMSMRARNRVRNRQGRLDRALAAATTDRQILAAAAEYFRSAFARADGETVRRVAKQLIEMTDREGGEQR